MGPDSVDRIAGAVDRLAAATLAAGAAQDGAAPGQTGRLRQECLRVVYRLLFVDLVRRRGGDVDPDEAVASLQLGVVPRRLLTAKLVAELTASVSGAATSAEPVTALGALHEQLLGRLATPVASRQPPLTGRGRKAGGSYFTPQPLVDWLLDRALEPTLEALPDVASVAVCDPSCGAGVFLVAATRRLRRRGLGTADAIARLTGVDTDPAALEIARIALWLELVQPGRSAPMPALDLVVDDALLGTTWEGGTAEGRYDVVVGNPPFLNQLERLTAHRPGVAAALNDRSQGVLRPYTDVSAVFLQRAVGWVRPGGRVGLVQPQSLLAARDAAGVRAYIAKTCALEALWASHVPIFDAQVLTCAPVLHRGARQQAIRRFHGPSFAEVEPRRDPELDDGWAVLAARGLGVPEVALSSRGVLADLAQCTADFRDQYYGLAPYVHEAAIAPTDDVAPLVTSGLIDPAELRWGSAPTRFLKRRWVAPVIDLEALRADEKLSSWAVRRMVPKVLVGTQGKVIEAVVDENGRWLPSVPTITVVPAEDQLWHVLAVLLAPPVAAHAAARYAGTALSMRAIKLSARQVGQLPLPPHAASWDRAAAAVRRAQAEPALRREHLAAAGRDMCAAYGAGDEVLDWWLGRL